MNKKFRHIASALALAGFLFIAFGSDEEQITEIEIASETPEIEVSAEQLYADYEANGVAADEKYYDKVVRVTGIVNGIDRDFYEDIYVSLQGDEYYGNVVCYFAESHVKEAAQLSKGQAITVKGLGGGKDGYPIIVGCTIE